MRKLLQRLLRKLAVWALHKNSTELVVFYGWDWVELLREGMYEVVHSSLNARRNTRWLKWDFALPLFLLGYHYDPTSSKFHILLLAFKAFFRLLFSKKYPDILIVSMVAVKPATAVFWAEILNEAKRIHVYTTPVKETQKAAAEVFASTIKTHKELKFDNPNQSPIKTVGEVMGNIVADLEIPGLKINEALYKLDWKNILLSRVKSNLQRNE